jgi:hypothetical protein
MPPGGIMEQLQMIEDGVPDGYGADSGATDAAPPLNNERSATTR